VVARTAFFSELGFDVDLAEAELMEGAARRLACFSLGVFFDSAVAREAERSFLSADFGFASAALGFGGACFRGRLGGVGSGSSWLSSPSSYSSSSWSETCVFVREDRAERADRARERCDATEGLRITLLECLVE
jgi:hypothetical protein